MRDKLKGHWLTLYNEGRPFNVYISYFKPDLQEEIPCSSKFRAYFKWDTGDFPLHK